MSGNKNVKNKRSKMMGLTALFILAAALTGLSSCEKKYKENDETIYQPIMKEEEKVTKIPRNKIIDQYEEKKDEFNDVLSYFKEKNTRYNIYISDDEVVSSPDTLPDEIKPKIKNLLSEYDYKSIFTTPITKSDNSETPSAWFLKDDSWNTFQQGLVYFEDPDTAMKVYRDNGNSFWSFQDLGNNLFYYYNYIAEIKREDEFKTIAFDALSKGQKDNLSPEKEYAKEYAMINIKDFYDEKTEEVRKSICVTFTTKTQGYGDDILVYIDGITMEVITVRTKLEDMFSS